MKQLNSLRHGSDSYYYECAILISIPRFLLPLRGSSRPFSDSLLTVRWRSTSLRHLLGNKIMLLCSPAGVLVALPSRLAKGGGREIMILNRLEC